MREAYPNYTVKVNFQCNCMLIVDVRSIHFVRLTSILMKMCVIEFTVKHMATEADRKFTSTGHDAQSIWEKMAFLTI